MSEVELPKDCPVLKAIKEEGMIYRKAGIKDKSFEMQSKVLCYSTLVGAITTKAKNEGTIPDDAMCIKEAQKLLVGVEDVLKYQPVGNALIKAQIEKIELLKHIPTKMNEKELEDSIVDLIREFGDKLNEKPGPQARLNKELQARYAGKYDGKQANALITKIISIPKKADNA